MRQDFEKFWFSNRVGFQFMHQLIKITEFEDYHFLPQVGGRAIETAAGRADNTDKSRIKKY